jgi:hypothetical protein
VNRQSIALVVVAPLALAALAVAVMHAPAAPAQAPAVGTAAPKAETGEATQSGKVREIDWLELMPAEDLKKMQEIPPVDHSGFVSAEQFMSFNTVPEFDKARGKMAGYIVPIDSNDRGELIEFFLVPYFGACIHVPPPPPNQIVYGKLEKPVPMPDMYAPYWIEGTLEIERTDNELGASAYTMQVDSVTLWEE